MLVFFFVAIFASKILGQTNAPSTQYFISCTDPDVSTTHLVVYETTFINSNYVAFSLPIKSDSSVVMGRAHWDSHGIVHLYANHTMYPLNPGHYVPNSGYGILTIDSNRKAKLIQEVPFLFESGNFTCAL